MGMISDKDRSSFQQDELTGSIFYNTRKTNPKQPDINGRFTLDGKQFELAGWEKASRITGQTYFSIKISEFKGGQQ
jgi:hypothetical protein